MKRFAALLAVLFVTATLTVNLRAATLPAQLPPLRPVLLTPPDDVPDVAQCRGILNQAILELVNNADEDPADTFEKNRRAHPHMLGMPATIECASKLFKVLKTKKVVGNFASVPSG